MNTLLDQLYAYTEADAQPQFENLALGDVLRDVVTNLDAAIQRADALVIFAELPVVCADRSQLTQLLQNLVGNGIKYCKAERPEVHVEAHKLECGDCVIEVRDNSISIDGKYFSEIFEPFRRLHSQGQYEGTGLGLATCKKIVERHNGKIWRKSWLDEGTSIIFSIPVVERRALAVAS
jgi:chemotaxis family two-component system sensor kinase Cph1